MPRRSGKRGDLRGQREERRKGAEQLGGSGLDGGEAHTPAARPRSMDRRRRGAGAAAEKDAEGGRIFDQDLHVLELGGGVLLDVFINVEGRVTTFVSVDGQLLAELPVLGQA